jgi:phage major head subunit gpT-like protein
MAVVPGDLATQWSTLFETLFLQEFNTTLAVERARLDALVMEIPLGDHMGNQVQLDWLGAAPQMQAWVDEKKAAGLGKFSWAITVNRYQASMEVDLDAFRDARFNMYEYRLREMAQNGARLRYQLVSDLIAAGASALCYDGQFFYDTDHSEGDSGAQSNKLTGSGNTQSNIEADFYAAKSALMGFRDDKGLPLAAGDFRPLVWIPNNAALEQRFRTLQGATTISNTTNVLAGGFDLVVDPRLTDTADWYMFRTDGMMRAFIVVNREAPNYADNFAAPVGDPFERRIGKASVMARMAATYGLWQKAVMINN